MMKSRIDNLPSFETRHTQVKAIHYNLVQVALKRLGSPLLFALPKLRNLDLYLEKDVWIVVDKSLNNIPIMAWIDFETSERASLHEDIPCTLKIYHSHAGILIKKIMEAMTLLIGEQLDLPDDEQARVLPIKKNSN